MLRGIVKCWRCWGEAADLWDAHVLRLKQWRYIPLILLIAALAIVINLAFAWSSSLAVDALASNVATPFAALTEWTTFFGATVDAVIVVMAVATTLWIVVMSLGAFLPRPMGMVIAAVNVYVIYSIFDYQAWGVLEIARFSPQPEAYRDSFDDWATLARGWTSLFAVAAALMAFGYTACNAWGLIRRGDAHKQTKCWTDLLP